ncbi:MAG TPA: hypothetical protein VD837_14910 [Terriglobales bacterium]|nr:hypothetical protein [Terriglobales bacterium]
MRKLNVLAFICLLVIGVSAARAQQIDAAFGFSTVSAPSAQDAGANFSPQSVGGGTFLSASADFLLKHQLGFGGQVAWRASQNLWGGYQPFRPIFFDFNGIYAPNFGRRAGAEFQAGIGVQSARFYTPTYNCSFTGCTNYVSSNHFMGHFGAGLRIYATERVFIRPEAHLYLVRNNEEFSGPRATRFGISIGYSFRPAEDENY